MQSSLLKILLQDFVPDIDSRYHFICEHVEDDFIKIIFVRTNENDADILTKNLNKETYEKKVVKLLGNF
jgi:hypothetical protein